jgi:hypothetical protein
MIVSVSMASTRSRTSCAESTGVLPVLTEWRGPRTDAAGFIGSTCPTTSQSNSDRSAAKRCFTDGADSDNCSMYAATCHRLHRAEVVDAERSTPAREVLACVRIGPARVGISNVGGEELDGPPLRGSVRRKQCRHREGTDGFTESQVHHGVGL